MTGVTRNMRLCEYCNEPFEPTQGPMAAKQRFCCTKHRVYASREGLYRATDAAEGHGDSEDTDSSVAAALRAAQAFTPVRLAETKTVASIRVRRTGADPVTWEVSVPSHSVTAATNIHQALTEYIGDLLTLANKLGAAIDEPRLVIGIRRKR
jgi:hypothetical protein